MGIVTIALDTFTDTDKNLVDHTPDSGFGGWTYSGATNEWKINSNQANKLLTDNDTQFCRCDLDVIDDEFEVYFDFTRGSAGDFAGEREGIYFLAHKTTAIANGEGVQVVLIRNGATTYNLFLKRLDSAGVEQQSVFLVASLSLSGGNSIRLGATISGLDVQVWTEPAGGGSRTNRGSAVTLTADLRDGNHKRIGMTGRSESNGVGPLMDNLTVTIDVSDGEVQEVVSILVAQNSQVTVVASTAAKFPGQVTADGSTNVFQNGGVQVVVSVAVEQKPGEVQEDVSIEVSQNSEVQEIVSVEVLQNGIVPIILSIFVAQNGTVQVAASIASDIGGRVQIDASINASQNGEVEVLASIEVVQRVNRQVTADGSINAAQNNQIQIAASVQVIPLGAVQAAVSIVVSQNAQVTVPVSISVLQAGGEVQIVASISVQENAQIFVNASVQAQVFVFLDGEVQVVASTQVDFHVGLDDRSGAVKHAYIPNSGRFVLRGDTLFIVDNETLRRQQKPAEGFGWDLDLISNPPGELIVKTDKPGSVPLQYKIDRDGGEFDMGVLRIEIPDDWPKT